MKRKIEESMWYSRKSAANELSREKVFARIVFKVERGTIQIGVTRLPRMTAMKESTISTMFPPSISL